MRNNWIGRWSFVFVIAALSMISVRGQEATQAVESETQVFVSVRFIKSSNVIKLDDFETEEIMPSHVRFPKDTDSTVVENEAAARSILVSEKVKEAMRDAGAALEVGLAAKMNDPQFQVFIRAIRQQKGVDLMPTPSQMMEFDSDLAVFRWGEHAVSVGADLRESDKNIVLSVLSQIPDGLVGKTLTSVKDQQTAILEIGGENEGSFFVAVRVEKQNVKGVTAAQQLEKLFTNTYTVPPTFGSEVHSDGVASDPFAEPMPVPGRPNAREVLEAVGITFPEGGSALYNPKASQLIVRTTQDQMELVEAYIDSIKGRVELQILLQVFFIESDTELWDQPGQPVGDGEGVAENSQFFSESVLSGKRMIELLGAAELETAVKEVSVKSNMNTAVNLGAVPVGVFTDPQLQVLLKAKQKTEGIKLIDAPSGMTRSGQSAFFCVGDHAVVIDPVLGADNFTVYVNVASRQKAELKNGTRRVERSRITLWDTQTVALREKTADEKFIYTFVRPQIVDAAGIPANLSPKEIVPKE